MYTEVQRCAPVCVLIHACTHIKARGEDYVPCITLYLPETGYLSQNPEPGLWPTSQSALSLSASHGSPEITGLHGHI